jgi:hypothetical protein
MSPISSHQQLGPDVGIADFEHYWKAIVTGMPSLA